MGTLLCGKLRSLHRGFLEQTASLRKVGLRECAYASPKLGIMQAIPSTLSALGQAAHWLLCWFGGGRRQSGSKLPHSKMATRQFCGPKSWWWLACRGAWYGHRRAGSSFRRIRAFLLRLAFPGAAPNSPGRLGTAHPFRRRIGFRLCRWRADRTTEPPLVCAAWLCRRASERRAGSFAYRQSALTGAPRLREKWRAPCARLRRGLSTMGGR